MSRILRKIWQDDSGQDMIEYALLAALVATGAVLLPTHLHGSIVHAFSAVTSCLVRLANPAST